MTSIKAKSIKALVDLTLSATNNEQIKFSLGIVSKPVAETVKEITGLDVDDMNV